MADRVYYEETMPKAVFSNVQEHSQEYDELNFEIHPAVDQMTVQANQQTYDQHEYETQVERRFRYRFIRALVISFVLQIVVAFAISALVGFYFGKAHADTKEELRQEFLELILARTNKSLQDRAEGHDQSRTAGDCINTCGPVAFFVRNPNGSKVDGRPIFKRIITNIGGGYDPIEAKFICPKSGLYEFNVALRTTSNQVDCTLKKNGVEITFIGTDGDDGTYFNMASQTVFIQVSVGDVVSLERCKHWDKVHDSIGSTFSGALIG